MPPCYGSVFHHRRSFFRWDVWIFAVRDVGDPREQMPPPSTGIEGIVLVVDRLGFKTTVPIGAVVGRQENFYCDRKAVNQ